MIKNLSRNRAPVDTDLIILSGSNFKKGNKGKLRIDKFLLRLK